MADVEFTVTRTKFQQESAGKEGFCLGLLMADAKALGYTLEDEDRHLELNPGAKVFGKTAIPRGRYQITVDRSERFSRKAGHDVFLPRILNVPTHAGVLMHGANHAEELEGCISTGREQTTDGVRDCAPVVAKSIALIRAAEARGDRCFITIR